MDPAALSLVLAENDLEAEAIVALAARAGVPGDQVVRLPRDWGARLVPGDVAASALSSSVALIELPGPEIEDALRRVGKQVLVIDHHLYRCPDGSLLDRRQPRSSLEQIAALLEQPLTADERLISANDRGFIPSLASLAGPADVARIRARELTIRMRFDPLGRSVEQALGEARAWLGEAEAQGRLTRLDCGRGRRTDPELLLLRAPLRHRTSLADALYLQEAERCPDDGRQQALQRRLETLILWADDAADGVLDAPVTGLFYSGTATAGPLIIDLLRASAERGDRASRLRLWAGGDDGVFLGASDDLGSETQALSELADRILNERLSGNRPLLGWRSHFLQVVETDLTDGPGPRYADFVSDAPPGERRQYFMQHIRHYYVPPTSKLDELKDPAAERRHLKAGAPPHLELRSYVWQAPGYRFEIELPDGSQIVVDLEALRVHLQHRGVAIVEWACAGGVKIDPPGKPDTRPPPLWSQLLQLAGQRADTSLRTAAQLLEVNRLLRSCISPFRNPSEAASIVLRAPTGDVAARLAFGQVISEVEFCGWFKHLANLVLGAFGRTFNKFVYDPRARVVSGAVAMGTPPQTAPGRAKEQVLLARLTTVEPYGAEHFSDPEFAAAELERGFYRRFASFGSHYATTDHSFVLLAYGNFAAAYILPDHLPNLYRRLYLIVLLHRAILHLFGDRLGDLSRDGIERRRLEFRDLRKDFVRFSNGLWVNQVSSQVQGRELFDLIRGQSPLAAEYELIKDKIERSDDFLQLLDADRAAGAEDAAKRRADFLSVLASFVAGFLLLPTLAGLTGEAPEGDLMGVEEFLGSVAERLAQTWGWTPSVAGMLWGASLLVGIAAFLLVKSMLRVRLIDLFTASQRPR